MPTIEEELAFSILYYVIKEGEGKAPFGMLRLKFLQNAKEIRDKYNVDVYGFFETVLKRFPGDSKTGYYALPQVLTEPKLPEVIAEEIIREAPPMVGPPEEVIYAANQYYALSKRMETVDKHLKRWMNTPEEVCSELRSTLGEDFFRIYANPPATFEFITAKSLSILFSIPLHVEYGAPMTLGMRECVVWRGKPRLNTRLDRYEGINHAPGGGSDVIVYARGFYILAEATLRYTKRQWKEEVEPIFRHAEDFIEQISLSPEDVYLVFVTPKSVLKGTYDWIHARAEEFNVLALDIENLVRLVKIPLFIVGLPHAEIRRSLINLHKRTLEDVVVETYIEHVNEEVDEWCGEVLRPYLDLFLATKAYEALIGRKGFAKVIKIIDELSNNAEVKDYLELGGIAKSNQIRRVLVRKRRDLLRYLSLFGLAREINGYLEALISEEFDNRLLKMYGYVKKIGKPAKP